jgi:hypothetical protein
MFGNLSAQAGVISTAQAVSPNIISAKLTWNFNDVFVLDFEPNIGNFNDRPRINVWRDRDGIPDFDFLIYAGAGRDFISPVPTGYFVQPFGDRNTGQYIFPSTSVGNEIIAGIDFFTHTFAPIKTATLSPPLNEWTVNTSTPGEIQYSYQFRLGEKNPQINIEIDYLSNCKPFQLIDCSGDALIYSGINNSGCPVFKCAEWTGGLLEITPVTETACSSSNITLNGYSFYRSSPLNLECEVPGLPTISHPCCCNMISYLSLFRPQLKIAQETINANKTIDMNNRCIESVPPPNGPGGISVGQCYDDSSEPFPFNKEDTFQFSIPGNKFSNTASLNFECLSNYIRSSAGDVVVNICKDQGIFIVLTSVINNNTIPIFQDCIVNSNNKLFPLPVICRGTYSSRVEQASFYNPPTNPGLIPTGRYKWVPNNVEVCNTNCPVPGKGGFGLWRFNNFSYSLINQSGAIVGIGNSIQNQRESIGLSSFYIVGGANNSQVGTLDLEFYDKMYSGQRVEFLANYSWNQGTRTISFLTGNNDSNYLFRIRHGNSSDQLIFEQATFNNIPFSSATIVQNIFNKKIAFSVENKGTGIEFSAQIGGTFPNYGNTGDNFTSIFKRSVSTQNINSNIISGIRFQAGGLTNININDRFNYGMFINQIYMSTSWLDFYPKLQLSSQTSNSYTLNWNSLTNAESYNIQFSSYPEFGDFEPMFSGVAGTTLTLTASPNSINFVRGSAIFKRFGGNPTLSGPFGPTLAIIIGTVGAPETPSAIYFAVFDVLNFPSIKKLVISISPVNNAEYYIIDLASDESFVNFYPGFQDKYIVASFEPSINIDLNCGSPVYVRVRAGNRFGISNYKSGAIGIDCGSPPAPTLSASNTTQRGFTLNWNRILSAEAYRIQISLSPDFSSVLYGVNDGEGNSEGITLLSAQEITSKSIFKLSTGTTYYIRIRVWEALGGGGASAWSNVISVTTLPPVPTLPPPNINSISYSRTSDFITISWTPVVSNQSHSYLVDLSASPVFAGANFLWDSVKNWAIGDPPPSVTVFSTSTFAGINFALRIATVDSNGGISIDTPVVNIPP